MMNQPSSSNNLTRRELLTASMGAAAVACSSPTAKKRPNILMLMSDQHRGDCMGADGNPTVSTPHLDQLAAEGARFRCAYSSTPSCTPARAGLLTGNSPWQHGMLGYARVAERYPVEMPRVLRESGYHTEGIGKMHWHPQRNLHGFHRVQLDESGRVQTPDFVSDYRQWFAKEAPDLDPDATGIGWNDYRAHPYVLPERLHPTAWTADRAVEFLKGYQQPEPFFLKVSFARPHSPYDPPQRFMDQYADSPLPEARVGGWAERYRERSDDSFNIWHGDLGPEQVRHSRQGYHGSVSFIDEQIGRILEALDARGELDETLILYFSDHGDMTGDHHMWRKCFAYEASARIPMLIRWPTGLVSAERGQVIDKPVEIRDVLPTLLDAADQGERDDMDGRSMLSLLRGGDTPWREFIDLEHSICYSPKNHWTALTDGRTKYIFHALDGEEQLFDLAADPHEQDDLVSDTSHENKLKLWRNRMIEHLAERGEPFVKNGKLMPRPERFLHSPHYPQPA